MPQTTTTSASTDIKVRLRPRSQTVQAIGGKTAVIARRPARRTGYASFSTTGNPVKPIVKQAPIKPQSSKGVHVDVMVRRKSKPKATLGQATQVTQQPQALQPVVVQSDAQPIQLVQPQPFPQPAMRRQQPSRVLRRMKKPVYQTGIKTKRARKHSRTQLALFAMACLTFVAGLVINVKTIEADNAAASISSTSSQIQK